MKELLFLSIILLGSCATSHESIRQRNEISGQRIKARIEKYGYRDPMKIQLLPSGYPDDQSSWTFHTPQGTVFIKTK